MDRQKVIWKPHDGPQTQFIQCPAMEVLYGGAIGGGKTAGLLAIVASGIELYGRAWKCVFFRRNYNDMDDVISESLEMFGPLYGMKCFNRSTKTWNFPSGAVLQFRPLEKDDEVLKYQGQQYALVMFDELTQWDTPFCYTYMFTRARSAKGAPVLFRSATNPGGPGHHWVKDRFVDIAPPGCLTEIVREGRNGVVHKYHRCYIPAKLEDNPTLMKNDPTYEARIFEMSDQSYAKALRDGDWDIIAGAAFPEFTKRTHVIPKGPIPKGAVIGHSLDWGYEKPYAYGIFYQDPASDDIILARELYGWGGEANVGSRRAAELVKEDIIAMQEMEGIYCRTGFIDGATMDKSDSGPTIFENLGGGANRTPGEMGWRPWPKGPGSRVNQKQMLHGVLKVVNGKSRFKIMDCCPHAIRTMLSMQTDRKNVEDVNTNGEDHFYDAIRGFLAGKKILTKKERDKRDMIIKLSHMERQKTMKQLKYGGF